MLLMLLLMPCYCCRMMKPIVKDWSTCGFAEWRCGEHNHTHVIDMCVDGWVLVVECQSP